LYKVNIDTGEYSVAVSDPALTPNTTAIAQLGVNGIHYRDGYVYFTNSFRVADWYGRIPLNPNGSATGPAEAIASGEHYPTNLGGLADDFALDPEGNAWVTGDPSAVLTKVTQSGEVTVVAGGTNSTLLEGDTSAAFGRTAKDEKTLYITTNGGLAYPVDGVITGGKVLALDTSGL
jgi:hypothetical protein